jgi:hypothetical protein
VEIASGVFRVNGTSGPAIAADSLVALSGVIELDCYARDEPCITAESISVANSSIEGSTNSLRLFGGPVAAPGPLDYVDWVMRYHRESLIPENVSGIPLFHSGPIVPSRLVFVREGDDSASERSVVIGPTGVAGLLVSVPAPGIYEVQSQGPSDGYLSPANSSVSLFWVSNGETFYPVVTIAKKGLELSSAQTTGVVIGAAVAVVLLILGLLSIWRWSIRAVYALRWEKRLAASGIEPYT